VKLSIVTTLYRSAATIDEFCRRAMKAAEDDRPIADPFERHHRTAAEFNIFREAGDLESGIVVK
jgi:hypothetical protein